MAASQQDSAGSAPPPTISATDVCWWGETLDGWSDIDVYLVPDAVKGPRWLRDDDPELTPELRALAVAVVKAMSTATRPRTPVGLYLTGAGGGQWNEVPTLEKNVYCDAVFLTPSAVRKFLLPYYEAQRLLSRDDLEKLRNADFRNVIGIPHYPPSRSVLLDETGNPIGMQKVAQDAYVLRQETKGTESTIVATSLATYVQTL